MAKKEKVKTPGETARDKVMTCFDGAVGLLSPSDYRYCVEELASIFELRLQGLIEEDEADGDE